MKEIVAIVKPFVAEKVLESLKRAPLEALSVHEVRGYGRQKSYLDEYQDTEYWSGKAISPGGCFLWVAVMIAPFN